MNYTAKKEIHEPLAKTHSFPLIFSLILSFFSWLRILVLKLVNWSKAKLFVFIRVSFESYQKNQFTIATTHFNFFIRNNREKIYFTRTKLKMCKNWLLCLTTINSFILLTLNVRWIVSKLYSSTWVSFSLQISVNAFMPCLISSDEIYFSFIFNTIEV